MKGDIIDEIENLTLEEPITAFPWQNPENFASDSEDVKAYVPGGYHPVKIGDTLQKGRYEVLKKLGWGHFSTVWLVFDFFEERCCAIKVQKSDVLYHDAALEEVQILTTLKKDRKRMKETVVEILDFFQHNGPNGLHMCLVFEVLSKSLLSALKRFNFKGLPLHLVKKVSRQILVGLQYIHETCGIIHTDIKPENILFIPHRKERESMQTATKTHAVLMRNVDNERDAAAAGVKYSHEENIDLTYDSANVKIVDFGNACRVRSSLVDHIQTRQYRAPEVILGCGYNTKADIWSFACLVFEMVTGDFLFDPRSSDKHERDEDHLALMMELLGPVPRLMVRKGKNSSKFFNNYELRNIQNLSRWNIIDMLRDKYKFSSRNALELAEFLLPMLYFNPVHRASARDQLRHSFLNDG